MEPILTLRDLGLTVGAVAVCVSLFIWNTLEIRGLKFLIANGQDESTKEASRNITLVAKIIEDQSKTSEQLAVIAANLVNLTGSVNQVVRELITVVRDGEK